MLPFSFHGAGGPPKPPVDAAALRFRKLVAVERKKLLTKVETCPTVSDVSSLSSLTPLTVCVRKRPVNAGETADGHFDVVTVPRTISGTVGNSLAVHEAKTRYDLQAIVTNHDFQFDRVYSEDCSNAEIYDDLVKPHIHKLREGLQLTIFAYGQTGSGKSYTMTGICERALRDAFTAASAAGKTKERMAVCVSFYEIYCSNVYDLLADRATLVIREDEEHAMQVVGLTEHSTYSLDTAQTLVAQGLDTRSSGVTKVNDESSRSHAILQIMLRRVSDGKLMGKLSLVDLAGSEQAHEAAPPDKTTAHEGAEINKSLLALKECIRAMNRGQRLGSGSALVAPTAAKTGRSKSAGAVSKGKAIVKRTRPPHTHIPFRGSKLTQVLRDCFTTAGSLTIMMATVSPTNLSTDHTLNTLRYASRLKDVGGKTMSTDGAVAQTASTSVPATERLVDNTAGIRVGVLAGIDMEFEHLMAKESVPKPARIPSRESDCTVEGETEEKLKIVARTSRSSECSVVDAAPVAPEAVVPAGIRAHEKISSREEDRPRRSLSQGKRPRTVAPVQVVPESGVPPKPARRVLDEMLLGNDEASAPSEEEVLKIIDARIRDLTNLRHKVSKSSSVDPKPEVTPPISLPPPATKSVAATEAATKSAKPAIVRNADAPVPPTMNAPPASRPVRRRSPPREVPRDLLDIAIKVVRGSSNIAAVQGHSAPSVVVESKAADILPSPPKLKRGVRKLLPTEQLPHFRVTEEKDVEAVEDVHLHHAKRSKKKEVSAKPLSALSINAARPPKIPGSGVGVGYSSALNSLMEEVIARSSSRQPKKVARAVASASAWKP